MPENNEMQSEYSRPAVNSLAIAVVKKVEPFGAYCMLPEFNDIEVFLPIREVSSGWVKNIHEFVHEGQKLVCRIIFYDTNKNTIDVSLKRVTPKESKDKLRAFNLEKRSKALVSQAIKIAKEQQSRDSIEKKIIADFGNYTKMIETAKYYPDQIDSSKLPRKFKEAIIKLLDSSNKKKDHSVSYTIKLQTTDTISGVTKLRKVFSEAQKNSGVSIT
ncbi:MAG: S1 RNA-binding domain-containing protein, partial [Candidatus Micrarchaeaceae archaeon]